MPIFLGGPALGGGDWRKKAITFLSKKFDKAYFILPCHFSQAKRYQRLAVKGIDPPYSSDVEWKRHYMEISAMAGCLVFWLGREDKEETSEISLEGPYACEVYGEQAEWAFRLARSESIKGVTSIPELKVVFGIHHSFPGYKIIVENWKELLGPDFPIYGRLQDVLEATVKMAK
jgi:hypothetical protein